MKKKILNKKTTLTSERKQNHICFKTSNRNLFFCLIASFNNYIQFCWEWTTKKPVFKKDILLLCCTCSQILSYNHILLGKCSILFVVTVRDGILRSLRTSVLLCIKQRFINKDKHTVKKTKVIYSLFIFYCVNCYKKVLLYLIFKT